MSPTVSVQTQPPSRVQANTTITPAPKVRLELDKTDPLASRDGEMVFHGDLYSVSGRLVACVNGSPAHVTHSGDRVLMDSSFRGIRMASKGTYYFALIVNFIDGTVGVRRWEMSRRMSLRFTKLWWELAILSSEDVVGWLVFLNASSLNSTYTPSRIEELTGDFGIGKNRLDDG
jgi:hypothetical protein